MILYFRLVHAYIYKHIVFFFRILHFYYTSEATLTSIVKHMNKENMLNHVNIFNLVRGSYIRLV